MVPRSEELVATATRHGGKEGAQKYFLNGMTTALKNIVSQAHPAFPITIYTHLSSLRRPRRKVRPARDGKRF